MDRFKQKSNLVPRDGELYWIESFLTREGADRYFTCFLRTLDWQHEELTIYGKTTRVPRKICWYGDPGAVYCYSGVRHEPLGWTPELAELRNLLEAYCDCTFNSVLGNLYHDGEDSMGWHADKEPELGQNPTIASLSLGDERLFKVRHNKTKLTRDIPLRHGDLLLMRGALQHHWRHCVPKTSNVKSPRINLTFRLIDMTQVRKG